MLPAAGLILGSTLRNGMVSNSDVKNRELLNAYTQGIDAYEKTAAVHLSSFVDCVFWIVDSAGTTYLSVETFCRCVVLRWVWFALVD